VNIKLSARFTPRAAGLLAGLALAALLNAPVIAKEKLPEVSSDGLHLLHDTKVAIAYAKPGATLDQYTKLKILDCFVDFKKGWQRGGRSDSALLGRTAGGSPGRDAADC